MTRLKLGISRRAFLAASAGGAVLGTLAGGGRRSSAADLLEEIKSRGYMRVGTFSIPPEC